MCIFSITCSVLLSICGAVGIEFVGFLISTKFEFYNTLQVSCLVCCLNLLVLFGSYDTFESAKVWVDLLGIQWYWISCGTDITSLFNLSIGMCWTTFVGCCIILSNGLISWVASSVDVIHSAVFVYVLFRFDIVPGRITVLYSLITIVGSFVGQCSELCGVLHGAMAIAVYKLL